MRRTTSSLVAALTLTAATTFAAGNAAPPATGAEAPAMPKIEFEKFTLPNGLQVILHVDRKLPIVHVNEWFHVGSKNEKPGRTGFAHLFEHMMFQGSKNAKEDYFVYVEKAGANIREGGVNGTTNNDRTNYFATVPSGNLENLLWVESDRIATLADATDQEKLDNQRDVVKNERRQGLENTPYGRAFTLIFEAVFPTGHPYSWPVIGSQEDLTAAKLDDVKEFFRQYYSPNNLSMVIAGDFDPAEAKRLVDEVLRRHPAGARARPSGQVGADAQLRESRRGQRSRLARARVHRLAVARVLRARRCGAGHRGAGPVRRPVVAANKALVYDQQLATAVAAFNATSEISSVFVVQATARPGVPLSKIEPIITAEIARLAKEGPTAAELERAKTKQESEFISGLERIGGFGGKADVLNQYNMFLGDPGKVDADLQRYRALTPADIQRAAASWLDTPNRAIIRFHPEKSQRPAQRDDVRPDRRCRRLAPTVRSRRPTVQTAKLANGLEVIVVERHDLPKVNVTLVSKAGAVGDPAGKAGVANLTMATIDLGTPTRKALEIEDALGALGTTLGGGAGRESARLTLRRVVAKPGAGARDRGRRRAAPDVPRGRVRTREEARARRHRAGRSQRQRAGPAHPADAGVRQRASLRAAGERA